MKQLEEIKSLDITFIDEDLSDLISTLTGWEVKLVSKSPTAHRYTGTHSFLLATYDGLNALVDKVACNMYDEMLELSPLPAKCFSYGGFVDHVKECLYKDTYVIDINDGYMIVDHENNL